MSASRYDAAPFRQVSDQEEPLTEIKDFCLALMLIANSLTNDGCRAVNRLAIAIENSVCEAERLRCEIFHLTHPDIAKQEGGE